jgi:hypothetical protein
MIEAATSAAPPKFWRLQVLINDNKTTYIQKAGNNMSNDNNNTQPEFDGNSVSWIEHPADTAWNQAQTIVSDARYSQQYKSEQVSELFKNALDTVETRYQDSIVDIEAKIKALEAAVNHAPILADEIDIAKLTYTRDVLQTRWQNMTLTEITADWTAAIERGDKITVKVYQDFAEAAMVAKNPTVNGMKSPHSPYYERLAEKSRDLLSTPEQKKAVKDLAYWKQTLLKVHMAHGGATIRLKNSRVGANNALTDGVRDAYMQRLRNR